MQTIIRHDRVGTLSSIVGRDANYSNQLAEITCICVLGVSISASVYDFDIDFGMCDIHVYFYFYFIVTSGK